MFVPIAFFLESCVLHARFLYRLDSLLVAPVFLIPQPPPLVPGRLKGPGTMMCIGIHSLSRRLFTHEKVHGPGSAREKDPVKE